MLVHLHKLPYTFGVLFISLVTEYVSWFNHCLSFMLYIYFYSKFNLIVFFLLFAITWNGKVILPTYLKSYYFFLSEPNSLRETKN